MTRLLFIFLCLSISSMAPASEMKLEGSCKGVEADGTIISFAYFSGFDGCENKSEAAITFAEDTSQAGLFTGTRLIQNGEDKYSFNRSKDKSEPTVWLILKDSTGNTDAVFKHRGLNGKITSVTLQCEVRDYEYSECER